MKKTTSLILPRTMLKRKGETQEQEEEFEPQGQPDTMPDGMDQVFPFEEDNRIYFYSEVDRQNVLMLNNSIRRVGNMLINRANNLDQPVGNMWLHLNSHGGSLFDGLVAMDYIRSSKVPIYTCIDGAAASAATLMSVAGKKRFMHKCSFVLIHQLSATAFGTWANILDEVESCSKLMNMIRGIYKQYTKIPSKKLDSILSRDVWFTSDEALKYGIVDEIIG